jgi:hypothetical protein
MPQSTEDGERRTVIMKSLNQPITQSTYTKNKFIQFRYHIYPVILQGPMLKILLF